LGVLTISGTAMVIITQAESIKIDIEKEGKNLQKGILQTIFG
jgi:hypothetical protein